MDIRPDSTQNHLDELKRAIGGIEAEKLDKLALLMLDAWKHNRLVLVMGNGGSSSTASHIVADMSKSLHQLFGRGIRCLCLSDSVPTLSAWANDTTWSNVFAPQVNLWADSQAIVIGISCSGTSKNFIAGLEEAKIVGSTTVALVGEPIGPMPAIAELNISIPSTNVQIIEDAHLACLHAVYRLVTNLIKQSL